MFMDSVYVLELPLGVLRTFETAHSLYQFSGNAITYYMITTLLSQLSDDDLELMDSADDNGMCPLSMDGFSLCGIKAFVSDFSFELSLIFFLSSFILLMIFIILIGLLINRINLFYILICIELLFLLMIMGFIFGSLIFVSFSIGSSIYVLYILAIAACEAVLGLSIFIIRTKIVTK